MPKIYHQAPLPFIGQKRNFIQYFRQILQQYLADDGQGWTIIDVFGGSGLLAHNAKRLKPKATVIYNDFDGYSERLKNIDDINRLREILKQFVSHIGYKKRIPDEMKPAILSQTKPL